MNGATAEDLAFLNQTWRESDEVGRGGLFEHGMINWSSLRMVEDNQGARIDKRA